MEDKAGRLGSLLCSFLGRPSGRGPKNLWRRLNGGSSKGNLLSWGGPRPWPQEIFGDVFWTVAPKVTFEDGFLKVERKADTPIRSASAAVELPRGPLTVHKECKT